MAEHLTPEELLTALRYCMSYIDGGNCVGCPNAVPGTANEDGLCECRWDTTNEMIRILEALIAEEKAKKC